ncbi:MAG: DUF4861 domain-containing protein [Prevotella sp.]|nr:DUF4861 domain-containing protein [Prevotella sp.]
MKRFLLILPFCCALSASSQQTVKVSVKNPLKTARADQPVVIPLPQAQYGDVWSALVTQDGKEVPCQLDDLDQDELFDELCFLADLKGRETKHYTVTLYAEGEPRPYPARVYAEMVMGNKSVKEKNKQNNYIEAITARGDCAYSYNLQHHHGVDFESELNGIRIYFDQRQTLDLYGKFKKRLELKETQFYTSDEQKQQGYGDDVLWVGNTFGLGAFRGWNGQQPTMIEPVRSRTQRVISYGPLRTIVEVVDRGWQAPLAGSPSATQPINMTLRYTQYAGHRDTDVDVLFNRDASAHRFSTGVINVKGSVEFSDKKGIRGCWGTDYPATDTLKWKRETVGLAVCVPQKNIVSEEPANKDNYAYVVKVEGRQMAYKVAYCSANEEFGFHSSQEWFDWLRQWRREVDQPVVVAIGK